MWANPLLPVWSGRHMQTNISMLQPLAQTAADQTESPVLADPKIFQAHLESLRDAPQWLIDLKQEAWERFQRLPMPIRKNEMWRFATVSKINLEGFLSGGSATNTLDPALSGTADILENGGSLNFADDICVGETALAEDLKAKGVIFSPLQVALKEHPDLVRKHLFERLPDLGSEKFQALHAALFTTGTFVYVPRNVEVTLPLVASHWTVQDGASIFPHTLVVAEDNAKLTMLDLYRSRDSSIRNFVCATSDVYAKAGSQVHYRMVQDWSLNTLAFHLNSASVERDAYLKTITVNVGGNYVRNEQHGRIFGAGAKVEMHSLGVVKGTQELDQRTLQTHAAGESVSDLLYKNALLDEARTIFSGLIRVERDSQRTDAYQTNRNLLLSPNADANSLPGLEIEANDVKCSHGATTGQLDETEMFYFLARGIPRKKAQELMVFGFFEEIIGKFENEELSDFVRSLVQKKLTA